MFLRPTFNHYFLLRVELNRIAALSVHDPEKAVLPAAEWKISHRSGHADVDPNVAGGSFVTEAARRSAARSEQRRLVTERAALQECHRFVHIVGVNQTEH